MRTSSCCTLATRALLSAQKRWASSLFIAVTVAESSWPDAAIPARRWNVRTASSPAGTRSLRRATCSSGGSAAAPVGTLICTAGMAVLLYFFFGFGGGGGGGSGFGQNITWPASFFGRRAPVYSKPPWKRTSDSWYSDLT